ncbi:aromatic amino acid lyase, partial [bacterium AH-315-K05]|nr:aromatic amino acid lyase [bacterium AH-315-K05]
IERLVNPQLSGLPAFLTEKGGLNSGFMIAQYSAASLVSENKVLSHPASVDSIPSSANQEDHVSMGTIAARKAREILFNATRVVAIELMAAAQGVEFSDSTKLGVGTAIAYKKIRKVVTKLTDDRVMYFDINKSAELIESNLIVEEVEKVIGELKS